MKNVIICDIDGTIADVRHRLHYIRNPDGSKKKYAEADWDAFHAACVDDPPFEDVIQIVTDLMFEYAASRSYKLHFLSGRNDTVREETVAWLERHVYENLFFMEHAELHMRKANDRRPDHEIKLEMVRQLGFTPDSVLCIFDDRQSVVDMWRKNGYRVLQVAAWREQ